MIHFIESELTSPGYTIDNVMGLDHTKKVYWKVEDICMDDIRLWLVEITSGATFAIMVDLGYDQ